MNVGLALDAEIRSQFSMSERSTLNRPDESAEPDKQNK
jgi:hypothetical protein